MDLAWRWERWAALVVGAGLWLAGCGGGSHPGDAMVDGAVPEAGSDAMGGDGSVDGSVDGAVDAPADAGPDARVDGGPPPAIGQTSGGGSLSGGGYRLWLSVGASEPQGVTTGGGHRLTVGPLSVRR